jgi:hypothetical protein
VEVRAPNFNHWWLLDVHRARRADVRRYFHDRSFDYPANVLAGLRDFFGPSTSWHPRTDTPTAPHAGHRQILGSYEAAYNRVLHAFPMAPVGWYVLLPAVWLWALWRARVLWREANVNTRARGALLAFCAFQVLYVTAASTMLTFLESRATTKSSPPSGCWRPARWSISGAHGDECHHWS